MGAAPYRRAGDGVVVSVRVTPRAAQNRVDSIAATAEGGCELRVRVTAAPEDGKANAAVIRLLATAWKVPKSSLSVIRGAADRRKAVHLAGDPATLEALLAGWLTSFDT